jgi:hypothetical protein
MSSPQGVFYHNHGFFSNLWCFADFIWCCKKQKILVAKQVQNEHNSELRGFDRFTTKDFQAVNEGG